MDDIHDMGVQFAEGAELLLGTEGDSRHAGWNTYGRGEEDMMCEAGKMGGAGT